MTRHGNLNVFIFQILKYRKVKKCSMQMETRQFRNEFNLCLTDGQCGKYIIHVETKPGVIEAGPFYPWDISNCL